MINLRDKILMREIYRSPVKQFEDDHTVPKSFHYVGSGVKVGQADRIVSWYKLRKSSKYHALYGDLHFGDGALTASSALARYEQCGESPLMKWQMHLFERLGEL